MRTTERAKDAKKILDLQRQVLLSDSVRRLVFLKHCCNPKGLLCPMGLLQFYKVFQTYGVTAYQCCRSVLWDLLQSYKVVFYSVCASACKSLSVCSIVSVPLRVFKCVYSLVSVPLHVCMCVFYGVCASACL